MQSKGLSRVFSNTTVQKHQLFGAQPSSQLGLVNSKYKNLAPITPIVYKSFRFSSVAKSCPTLCDPMNHSRPGLPVHHQLPESTQTHFHRVGDAIRPSHPLLSPSRPVLNFPSIRVFSNESVLCIRWPKYWSFSFNISPSNEHQGLISFRMDRFDLLAVQGTLKSLLQYHSSKASILQHSD